MGEEKSSKLDEDELKEMRRIRFLDIMLWSILNEVGIYVVFLMVLYAISFFNLNNSSFVYNKLFLSTFVNQQSQSGLGLKNVFVIFSFHFTFILVHLTSPLAVFFNSNKDIIFVT